MWTSSDYAVATVKDGVVTAKSEGTATITAACGSAAPVTVRDCACTDKSYPRFWADLAALTAVPAAETTKPDEGA